MLFLTACVCASPVGNSLLPPTDPLRIAADEVPDDSGLRLINITYTVPNNTMQCLKGLLRCSDVSFRMLGYMPERTGRYPAYLFLSGAGPWQNEIRNRPFDEDVPDMISPRMMAKLGYAAVITEFPDIYGEHMRCNALSDGTPTLMSYARTILGYNGPHDTVSRGALATLCRYAGVDCTLGIALHGHSVGGLISNLAPRYAPVTGMLLWGMGSRLPGSFSCCGHQSQNYSCCTPSDGTYSPAGEPQTIGGMGLPCETYDAKGAHLDRSRKRLIIARVDYEYGDCDRDRRDLIQSGNPAYANLRFCDEPNGLGPFGALILARRDSGYDCGNSANCIQADGSGYMIPSEYQIGHEAATTNPHNFHTVVPTQQCDRYFSNGECAHSIEYGYVLNPIWVRSPEPWGMRPSLEWLASTASVRAPALLL